MWEVGVAIVAVVVAAVLSAALWLGTTATGPNCLGMDPAWIGWCE